MKLVKSILFAFVLVIASATMAFSQSADAAQKKAAVTTKTSTISVKGVTCANDLATISGNVEKLDGVKSFAVAKKGATSKFEVKFNPAVVTEKEIHAAIEGTPGCKDPNDRPYKVKQ